MKQDNDPCGHDVLFLAHTHACVFSIRGLGSGISVPRWFKSRCSICSVGPSDDRVQGVVEPLHSQLDHLSQGVVLRALLLAAHRLMGKRGSRWERNDKHIALLLGATGWKLLTLVSKQMWAVLPSTVTETLLPPLKSTQSSPNMSLKTEAKCYDWSTVQYPFECFCVYDIINKFMLIVSPTAASLLVGFGRRPYPWWRSGSPWLFIMNHSKKELRNTNTTTIRTHNV